MNKFRCFYMLPFLAGLPCIASVRCGLPAASLAPRRYGTVENTHTLLSDTPAEAARNWGIDLLRLVSMFMVVMLHLSDYIRLHAAHDDALYAFAGEPVYILRIFLYSSVDIFALISGYVGIRSRVRFSRLAALWLQIIYHTVLITVAFAIIRPDTVERLHWVKAFLPIVKREYWYTTKYFIMFLALPLIHFVIKHLSVTLHGALTLLLFIPCAFIPAATGRPMGMRSGYSAAWLAMLYIAGAYLRRSDKLRHVAAPLWLALLLTSVAGEYLIHLTGCERWLSYISPLTVLIAVCMVQLFANAGIRSLWLRRIITRLSPAAFAVFIIHVHTLPWNYCMTGIPSRFGFWDSRTFTALLLRLIAASLTVFAICIALDLLRIRLFDKLRIKERLIRAEEKLRDRLCLNNR